MAFKTRCGCHWKEVLPTSCTWLKRGALPQLYTPTVHFRQRAALAYGTNPGTIYNPASHLQSTQSLPTKEAAPVPQLHRLSCHLGQAPILKQLPEKTFIYHLLTLLLEKKCICLHVQCAAFLWTWDMNMPFSCPKMKSFLKVRTSSFHWKGSDTVWWLSEWMGSDGWMGSQSSARRKGRTHQKAPTHQQPQNNAQSQQPLALRHTYRNHAGSSKLCGKSPDPGANPTILELETHSRDIIPTSF